MMKSMTFLVALGATFATASPVVQKRQNQLEGQTVVLFEVNGVPNNECLTFRNNGEIVDAACVLEAADRQMTLTTVNGQEALVLQREFGGERPDLAGQQACVGFNGTHFRAEDCNNGDIDLVIFTGRSLVASNSNACLNGHNDIAEIIVDANGNQCSDVMFQSVTPTPP